MANPDGTPIWFELNTSDLDQAKDFLTSVLGWTIAPSPMAENGKYCTGSAPDGEGVGGIMQPPPDMPGFPGWVIYFGTGDVDAMTARVTALGGKIRFGPMDIPDVGRMASCIDSQGVVFNIMRGNKSEDSTAFKPMAGDAGLGHGVWIELAIPDPDAALAFYGDLFGWSKQGAMPMGEMGEYAFFGRSETDRPGAIMSSKTTGAAARWNMYFQVADVDAAIEKAKAVGGTLKQGPDEIPGGDFSANLADAQGHQIGIVGPRK